MRNPWLKEHLLDDEAPEVELPTVSTSGTELEQLIKKYALEYPAETQEEKSIRISIEDRIDRVVIVGYGLVVAISVLSCSAAMWFTSSGVLELLFTISFLQGPFVVYQRLRLIRSRSKREAIATLWSDSKSINQLNEGMEADIASMQKDMERLRSNLSRYKSLITGYDVSGITDLYHENERINEQKKMLAEAIGLEKLTKSILRTDVDRDHYIGEAELALLAQRVVLMEGIQFSSEEVSERFRLEETRSLRNLADVVRTLYIEKRLEQEVEKKSALEKRPRSLGAPLLWKRKISGIGITV